MKRKLPLHVKILLGMVLGLGWGILAVNLGPSWVKLSQDFIHPFGNIFMNLLKLIAIPMILTSLITGIASLNDIGKLGRIGGKTIAIFLGTTVIAITIGLVLVNVIQPGKQLSAETRDMLMQSNQEQMLAKTKVAEEVKNRPALQPLVDLFPDNVIHAAGDNGNMLQIVIFAIFLGIAITLIPNEKSAPLVQLMDSANEVVMKVVDLIMILAPLGVFALLSQVIVDLAKDDPSQILGLLQALGIYSLTVIGALVLHMSITYLGLVKLVAKMNPWTFLKKMRPVQLLAFSTSSSNATLPVNMENCEEELGVDEEITGFVLPLGATINMDGTSCYQAIAAVFIAQVFNMDLSLMEQLTIILTALLSSVGSAGVPGAGVVMLVIVLNSVGVPVEGIALILGVDRILDMCRTAVNVTGDAAVCCSIARMEGKLKSE
ncbi:MAG: dicarboxylate/amino acid:cation symporter [Bacteroidota bacterium]|nr:dicarboxylate/amino acid:cation symporter [Bacteroidota bacterium]MDX5468230.1 dicarboxylate/amino acid:cation symporter [Bacteroidota bacterium]